MNSLKKKMSHFLLAAGITLGTLTVSTPAFADDITGITLETEIREMIDTGVMRGYGDGIYKPNEQVSRGQFATFMARALDLPTGESHFKDVPPSATLASGINKAASAKIVSGYTDGTFRPNQNITREQMAAMIARAMDYLQIEKHRSPLDFTDTNKIGSEPFKLAISNNVYYGIIQGYQNQDGTYSFKPKADATRAQAAAFIYRLLQVETNANQDQDQDDDEVIIDHYQLASISSTGQLMPKPTTYQTYEQAAAAMASQNEVVVQGTNVVKMKSGVVFAKKSPTTLSNSNLRDVIGIQVGSEMKYLDSDGKQVKVQIADTIGYVNLADVTLVPTAMMTGRSYYTAQNGMLVHTIYRDGKYESYTYGVAPSNLASGQKYYSVNGDTFQNTDGTVVAQSYQYFNVLSLRTKTNYTAEELNAYVAKNYPTSPLKGLGAVLKEAESTYHVNALYILAKAANESAWGTSDKAKTLNNLFGVGVYDSDPNSGQKYASYKESIMFFANKVSTHYLTPGGKYYYGAIAGDKHWGVNVKYATDPYSEQKVAGIMYRVDKALGQKDWLKYDIAEVTGLDQNYQLRARPEANTNQEAYYMYQDNGYPMTIMEKTTGTDGTPWFKIVSDMATHDFAYVSGDYVKTLPIAGE